MNLLLTGATGFIGTAVRERLHRLPDRATRACIRQLTQRSDSSIDWRVVGELGPDTDWADALAGVDVVVHLAARVHVMQEASQDPLASFLHVNTDATLHLARQAARAGVRRLVFLSSIKVQGEQTNPRLPFRAGDNPAPQDAYAVSKQRAETGLCEIAAATGLELVIIRPPLVHGPGVKANFAVLMRAVARGLPLPFGAIDNRRSLVGVDNLVDLIITCTTHPAAAGQTFLVSDGEDVSTPELARRLGRAMGRPARLLPVPVWALKAGAAALGRAAAAERLCGNLQVDMTATCERLGWTPPVSLDEGLRRAVAGHARP